MIILKKCWWLCKVDDILKNVTNTIESHSNSKRNDTSGGISQVLNPLNLPVPGLSGSSKRSENNTSSDISGDIQQAIKDFLPSKRDDSSGGLDKLLNPLNLPIPGLSSSSSKRAENNTSSDISGDIQQAIKEFLPSKRDDQLLNGLTDILKNFGIQLPDNGDLLKQITGLLNGSTSSKRDDQLISGLTGILKNFGIELPDNGDLLKQITGLLQNGGNSSQ